MSVFSFRAECEHDVKCFNEACKKAGIPVDYVMTKHHICPDVYVDMAETNLSLETILDIMRQIPDSHVMMQTLRPMTLEENPLDRDFDVI